MWRGLRGGSGVQQHIQPRQTDDKSSPSEIEVVWNDWCNDDDVLEVHGLRGGSGVQQRIQPRQTNDESSLLELVVVQDEGGDNKTPGSTGTERRKWEQSNYMCSKGSKRLQFLSETVGVSTIYS